MVVYALYSTLCCLVCIQHSPLCDSSCVHTFQTIAILPLCRNAIVLSPHVRAAKCSIEAARIVRQAAEAAGAPPGLIQWIDKPSLALATALMKDPKINLILATGVTVMIMYEHTCDLLSLGLSTDMLHVCGRYQHIQYVASLLAGGPGMVKAAYESGHPSIGVGAGNTPAVIDSTADIPMAVSSILISKTFDNGKLLTAGITS